MNIETNSSISTWKACNYRYYLEYVKLIKKAKRTESLFFGGVFHEAMEILYRDGKDRAKLYIDSINKGDVESEKMQFDLECMINGYFNSDLYDKEERQYMIGDTPAIEVELTMDIPNTNVKLAFKIDRIIIRQNMVIIRDYKTSSTDISVDSDYMETLLTSSQASLYLLGCKSAGLNPDAVEFQVFRKPRIKPLLATPKDKIRFKKDGTPYANIRLRDETMQAYRERLAEHISADIPSYYQAALTQRFSGEYKVILSDLQHSINQIQFAAKTHAYPKNEAQCLKFKGYGRCSFYNHCRNNCDLKDKEYFTGKDKKHEEYNNL